MKNKYVIPDDKIPFIPVERGVTDAKKRFIGTIENEFHNFLESQDKRTEETEESEF